MNSRMRLGIVAVGVIVIGLVALSRCAGQTAPVTGTLPAPQSTAPGVTTVAPGVTPVLGTAVAPPPGATAESGTPATIPVEDDVPMVRVPAGEFIMGSAGEEIVHWESMRCMGGHCGYTDYLSDEWPQMIVYLDEFEIDRVEVTYARYERCVEAGVCSPPREPAPSPDHPVLAEWEDADEALNMVSNVGE